MPAIPVLPYHEFPNLRVLLDLLGRCAPDGQHVAARYDDMGRMSAAEAACRRLQILPLVDRAQFQHSVGNRDPRPCLRVSSANWHALSKNVLSMLTGQLRLLFQAFDDWCRLTPVPWGALPLPSRALAAWGTAAGMLALPLETASSYLACRYPANSVMRRQFEPIDDAFRASSYKTRHALGFLITLECGTKYLACHGNDWRSELDSTTARLKHHLRLTIRIGLQLANTGDTNALPDMCWALGCAGEAPLVSKMHGLLQDYMAHTMANAPGPDPVGAQLRQQCAQAYRQLQQGVWQLATNVPRPVSAGPAAGNGAASQWSSVDNPFQSEAPSIDLPTSSRQCIALVLEQIGPHRQAPERGAPKRKREVDDVSGGDRKRYRIGADGQEHAPAIRSEPAGRHAGTLPVTVPVHVFFIESQRMVRAPAPALARMATSSLTNAANSTGHVDPGPDAYDGRLPAPRQRAVAAPADVNGEARDPLTAIRPFSAFRLSMPDQAVERTVQGETRDAAPVFLQVFPIPIFQVRNPWS
jgi:hypothetical protein